MCQRVSTLVVLKVCIRQNKVEILYNSKSWALINHFIRLSNKQTLWTLPKSLLASAIRNGRAGCMNSAALLYNDFLKQYRAVFFQRLFRCDCNEHRLQAVVNIDRNFGIVDNCLYEQGYFFCEGSHVAFQEKV